MLLTGEQASSSETMCILELNKEANRLSIVRAVFLTEKEDTEDRGNTKMNPAVLQWNQR